MRATLRGPYPVFIGEHLLRTFDFGKYPASSYVVITDATVDRLFFGQLNANRTLPSQRTYKIIVPKGEGSKSLAQVEHILRKLAQTEIDKDTMFIALGGGVIGDITGFVASIYKRGVSFIQLPTTLLAQVDSSLGAKNAINLSEGKNLVGTHNEPQAVISDISLIDKLPRTELSAGMAEIIKYGMIADKKLFEFVEQNISRPTLATYKHLVNNGARIKLAIAERDPLEKEYRKILNYGHTIGHALEIASDYKLSHGQAVALGMMGEAEIARMLSILPVAAMERQNNLINSLKVKLNFQFDEEVLLELMRRDKKSKRRKLYFVLPQEIGKIYQVKGQVAFPVAEHVVRKSLQKLRRLAS